jgi:hypothetical protein
MWSRGARRFWSANHFSRRRGHSRPIADDVLQIRRDVDVNWRGGERPGDRAWQATRSVANDHRRYAEAILLSHPSLCRSIPEMMGTNAGRAFCLDELPAAPAIGLKDVRSNDHVLVQKSRFEYRSVRGAR